MQKFLNVKDEFEFIAPVGNLGKCGFAIETKTKPFIISDMGDNPTVSAGDVTWTLDRLLKKEFKKSDGPS